MVNPSKRKGTQFETDVARYASERLGITIERRALAGNADKGDLIGMPMGMGVECKNTASIDLAAAQNELAAEMKNAGVPLGVAIHKRRNHGVQDAYAVLPLHLLFDLLAQINLMHGDA